MTPPTDKTTRDHALTSYLRTSLDHMKRFVDRTSDEIAKADLVSANRRLANTMIDGAKSTLDRVSKSATERDPLAAVHNMTLGLLDGAHDLVRVASEEAQRINMVEAGTELSEATIELLRHQADVTYQASVTSSEWMGHQLDTATHRVRDGLRGVGARMAAAGEPDKRPGNVTRVHIETEPETERGHIHNHHEQHH